MQKRILLLLILCILGALSQNPSFFSSLLTRSHSHSHQPQSPRRGSSSPLIWPLPTSLQSTPSAPMQANPCLISYIIQANPNQNVNAMLRYYLQQVFKCKELVPGSIQMNIVVKNASQMIAEKKGQQRYSLVIRTNGKWELVADCYVGFLRGIETFSQVFQKVQDKFYVNGAPIVIEDNPDYFWRGVMIDSSRHFLPISAIKHAIDGLMFNKMSVLHWHITDQDSFPMEVDTRPQLSSYGKFSGTYSKAQIKDIIQYALIRGIRVIPQFDTPAHTESWGRSPALKQIVVKCNNEYAGQFDPTLNLTYQVVTDVMRYVNTVFPDTYAHFGGDQIVQSCYDKKPSIKAWMSQHNISNYSQLSNYYRRRQKTLWRSLSPKKAIYWANEQIDMPLQADDVIQWWGVAKNVDRMAGRKNKVILSNYDIVYLDVGFGGRRGTGYGTFISWRDLYKFEPRVKDVNVIGGETCMWAETSNQEDFDQKVWTRTAVLGERLWNVGIDGTKDILNIVQRLTAHSRRMKQRGFKVSPVTVGLCEKDPSICFGNG